MLDLEKSHIQQEDREILMHPQTGGLILFSRNYECPQQLDELIKEIRALRAPLIIAVDHEGGRVQRFREGFTRIPAMQKLGQFHDSEPERALALTEDVGWLLASELIAYDIDMSFAPVLDIDDDFSDVIGDRAFFSNPESVIQLAGAFIDGMHSAGMAATGKHFPGHGSVKADSHLALPVDERSMAEIEAHDIRPFKALLNRLDAIMPAHIRVPAFDDELVGFSKPWLVDYLKGKLDYQGVIFSDDLSMFGAATVGDIRARVHSALDAGCDVALVCNSRKDAELALEYVEGQTSLRGDSRLWRMRRSEQYSLPMLKAQARWEQTVEQINKL
ncbi:MAG: beta-N-acetylhexosaminidase [Alteromonadaceae bacterium]|nr:MAG: beta-N-acetylhexosaminidase [Alteromonadaceae bacterium]